MLVWYPCCDWKTFVFSSIRTIYRLMWLDGFVRFHLHIICIRHLAGSSVSRFRSGTGERWVDETQRHPEKYMMGFLIIYSVCSSDMLTGWVLGVFQFWKWKKCEATMECFGISLRRSKNVTIVNFWPRALPDVRFISVVFMNLINPQPFSPWSNIRSMHYDFVFSCHTLICVKKVYWLYQSGDVCTRILVHFFLKSLPVHHLWYDLCNSWQ